MVSICEKMNCGYWWQEEDENSPCCHYNDPWPAPCEDDEFGDCDNDYLEVGFNHYNGCYDFDC